MVTDVIPYTFDKKLNRYVIAADTPLDFWKEGHGCTTFGRHGIQGEISAKAATGMSANPAGGLVVFWGDSFVEGLQVMPRQKLHVQFNQIRNGKTSPNMRAISIARSGQDLSDYFHLIPRYEKFLPPVACHVVLMKLDDSMPNGKTIFPGHEPGSTVFVDVPYVPQNLPLKHVLHRWNLSVFYWPLQSLAVELPQIRFRPQKQENVASAAVSSGTAVPVLASTNRRKHWQRLLGMFRRTTNTPILLLLYTPLPTIQKGKIVTEPENRYALDLAEFMEIAHDNGISCVSLLPRFVAFQRQTGRFPTGFFNTRPGFGHINADGHRLIAEATADWIAQSASPKMAMEN
ncbi:MAG: hypothetical protein K8S55_08040 [Phycisphaerae bacterium]|nr:hypothetical protein [Phycisphaerae bacterium]